MNFDPVTSSERAFNWPTFNTIAETLNYNFNV